ncbi:MAG: DinB family protein, partial [Acidobacteriota bacterium]|nr:DinB family protein [Acidobacteriota bacterium]
MRIPIDVTRTFLRTLLVLLAPSAVAFAQETPPAPPRAAFALPKENPLTAWNKYMYGRLGDIVLRSAEKMPEESYSFKPTDTVRSYGQILGHIADAQYLFCSVAMGEKNPAPKIEQTRTSKADLAAALKESFAYCDRAYDGMTDATAVQMVRMF